MTWLKDCTNFNLLFSNYTTLLLPLLFVSNDFRLSTDEKKIKITQIMGVTAYYDPFWSYLLMLTINLYSKYSFLCKPNFHYTLDLVLYVAHSLSRADGVLVKMKSYPCPQWTVWLDLMNELLVYMNWKLNQTHHSLCLTEQAHISTSTSSDTIALFLCTCSFLVL